MKRIAIAILLILGFQNLNAQLVYSSSGRPVSAKKKDPKKGFDTHRIIFGGGFGFGFGNVTNVSVSPMLGYRISDNFSAGVGFGYQYLRVKDYYALYDANNVEYRKPFTANMYSPSIWGRYVIWHNIFAHLEYEHNFMTYTDYKPNYTIALNYYEQVNVKYNAPSILIGGGIKQPLTDRVSILFMGLYDVLQDQHSPYKGSLAFRFGVVVGF
jgi:hypothetical protein